MEHGVLSRLALIGIVLQRLERSVAQNQNGGDVDDDHDRLEHIGRIPRKPRADECAEEHNDRSNDSEHRHKRAPRIALEDILQTALAVIIVADERGERKQAHGYRDEDRSDAAERILHCSLHIGRALQLLRRSDAGAQAHQRGGRADQQRVNKHGQHLYQPLLCRVGHIRRGGRIRRRAHAGFVGIQAALDALHHGRACKAAEDGPEIKCIRENSAQNAGEQADMHDDDGEGDQNVDDAHDRNEHAGDLGQALRAAQHAHSE